MIDFEQYLCLSMQIYDCIIVLQLLIDKEYIYIYSTSVVKCV